MRFHKTLTFLILAMGLVFALSAWAQPKIVEPTLRACPDLAEGSARADVAASLPRHGGVPIGSGQVPPPLRNVGPSSAGPRRNAVRPYVACAPALPPRAEQKPFTQEQVSSMVRDGFGDDSGAKLIEQRGIDFAPSEDFYQTLKAAGASEAFLNALRAAQPPEPASAKKPLNQVQVFALLAGGVPSHRVTMLVQERGIDFEPTDDYLQEVRLAGGEDELIGALKGAKVTKPVAVGQAVQARQAEVRQRVARGAQLEQKGEYAEAEQEYRAALLLAPQNADLYAALAYVLGRQEKWDETASAEREALRLNPDDDMAHNNLGAALAHKGDWDGEITEDREALHLNPNNALAHFGLGAALAHKRDWDGAITEYREALRLNPNLAGGWYSLGLAYFHAGQYDQSLSAEQEAIRLEPGNAGAWVSLGIAYGILDKNREAVNAYREAIRLKPDIVEAWVNLGRTYGDLGQYDQYLSAEQEAIRLRPDLADVWVSLGNAYHSLRQYDQEISADQEAIRLEPRNVGAWFNLGSGYNRHGQRSEVMKVYERLKTLDPKLADRFFQMVVLPPEDTTRPRK